MSIWNRTMVVLAAALLIHCLNPGYSGEKKKVPAINNAKPAGPAPAGMAWIPGGSFWMGSEDFDDTKPVHLVYVDPFWMDKTEVTNEQFARFVKETKYITVAERKPDAKEFPDVPAEMLKPFSIVFKQPAPNAKIDLKNYREWWDLRYGASWKHPEGPNSDLKGREKHPAVHICWHDAVAYCKWAKKRLPTEAEWEFAARGGLDRNIYCWGNQLKPNKKWMANFWQGDFPYKNTCEDGFEGTASVGSFSANGFGLFDMSGNVWEWCSDWYRADAYTKEPQRNPKGPDKSHDPAEPNVSKRVQRGGSFLCADNYCKRYLPGGRIAGEISSAANHTGFRCVRDR